jgi:hypothetical protein
MITTAFRQNVNSLEATGEMTMKIKVKREILLKGLQRVCNIIGSRTTIPVLANIVMSSIN